MAGKIFSGNRVPWLIAIVALPVPAWLAYQVYPIGCKCWYGSASADLFMKGLYMIWARLLVALILGENRDKILFYMVMPFFVALVVTIVGNLAEPHAH